MQALPGWPHAEPPFHAGEASLQRRLGVEARMQEIGRRVMRAEMPAQHREMYAALPFMVLGAPDGQGPPWATVVGGAAPGWLRTPDASTLELAAWPQPGDPLQDAIRPGVHVGLLGIDPATRRRNRVNGEVTETGDTAWRLDVAQSFGNCPQFIRRRAWVPEGTASEGAAPVMQRQLDAAQVDTVRRADTFFIATLALAESANGGADVSHRGGRPGFVRVADDGSYLAWPEFAGNRFYNTLGNLMLQPRAGLLFVDFERGDLLHVAGRATVHDDPAVLQAASEEAEYVVRFEIDRVVARRAAMPWRMEPLEPTAPALS